jgi:hypothetical protein
MKAQESIPPELLLSGYPAEIQEIAECLRGVVHDAVPTAIERVRTGWRLIGYDVPVGRRTRYFAFVMLEPAHVHLGFQYGLWMADPDHVLRGAHLNLRKVRYVTFVPGDAIPTEALERFTREAATWRRLDPQGGHRPADPGLVGVEQLEHRSHRLERGQRSWPEQDLDLREAPGAERPESVGDLLG